MNKKQRLKNHDLLRLRIFFIDTYHTTVYSLKSLVCPEGFPHNSVFLSRLPFNNASIRSLSPGLALPLQLCEAALVDDGPLTFILIEAPLPTMSFTLPMRDTPVHL